MVNEIHLMRKGRKNKREFAFAYLDKPNVMYVAKNPNFRATPKRMSHILGHESVHTVLQKKIGQKANTSYDKISFKNKKVKWTGI
jgi:hypothetical protein